MDDGAFHDTPSSPLPERTAVTAVGAPGALHVVTALLAADAVLVPALFVDVTVKVYDVPLSSPVMVQVVVAVAHVRPPGDAVAV